MLELCKRCTDSRLRSAAHGDFSYSKDAPALHRQIIQVERRGVHSVQDYAL